MTIRGVLFDFSGTLFHLEPSADWFDGYPLDRARLIDVLTSPTTPVPAELRDAWAQRDLDPETHRMVYLAILRTAAPNVGDGVLDKIYGRIYSAESWLPYPDTAAALGRLRDAGIPVAVVSNIPWDIRPVFDRNGMAGLVDAFVLSYAEGVMKPDPTIFRTACRRIGVAPAEALMIGDSIEADGGATRAGCQFAVVKRVPPGERPDALLTTLARTISR